MYAKYTEKYPHTDTERAERLRKIIEALHEINQIIPVIVEGKKDASALRRLGLPGDIITLHNGKNLYDFCEDIFHRVIIRWCPIGTRRVKT